MEGGGSQPQGQDPYDYDEENKQCTVLASPTSSTRTKTVFDTISFTMQHRGDEGSLGISSGSAAPAPPEPLPSSNPVPPNSGTRSDIVLDLFGESISESGDGVNVSNLGDTFGSLNLVEQSAGGQQQQVTTLVSAPYVEPQPPVEDMSFNNTCNPVMFPVAESQQQQQSMGQPLYPFPSDFGGETLLYSQQPITHPEPILQPKLPAVDDAVYEAWLPSENTTNILKSISLGVQAGTYFADKSNMTTPGIIYEDDLIDKVGVNVSRIFGEAEASKRRILNANNVTQDDNGLRELIKLGCYRSAINLTRRLLTLYGQGPGRCGQFSKHNPHTLQLWFTRITLLIRIREFTIAESEIDAFRDFENPDLYYEYYPESYGKGRKGSMVPFHFRVLAAEILQYSKKHNVTIEKLQGMLSTVQQIIRNVAEGVAPFETDTNKNVEEAKERWLRVWREREIRVLYSLANASMFAKDHHNAFKYMTLLCEKDREKEPQLKSALARFFLQLGDVSTASTYFQEASDLRQGIPGSEADNLIDAALGAIAVGSYPEAFAILQQALLIQPDNFMITNNMAVCLLYMGKLKESLSLMEATVKNNIPQLLQENVLLNLSTIYELENTDGVKKNALLKLVAEYKGDGINLASLKMPNLI